MGVRRPLIASLSTTGGGALFALMAVSLGFALYAAVLPDGISAPAAADSIVVAPTVRHQPLPRPEAERTASLIPMNSLPASAKPDALPQAHDVQTAPSPATATPTTPNELSASVPTMLDRPWAPAGMLVPSKEMSADVAASPPQHAPVPAAEVTAENTPAPRDPDPRVAAASTLDPEGSKWPPAVHPTDPSVLGYASDVELAPRAVKTKKAKSAKRRSLKEDDMETSISKGFDTLQRSLSSMF